MKKLFLLSSNLLILIIITLVAKSSAKPIKPRNNSVTDQLIGKICPKTGNPNFCQTILNQFNGKLLYPKSVTSINVIAIDQAKTTGKQIWNLYSSANSPELKSRLHKCWQKYTVASSRLTKANVVFVQTNVARYVVNSNATLAMSAGQSCERELAGQVKHVVPSNVADGSRRFLELCRIVIALCDEIK